ncbi:hypothetical protein BGX26_004227, partial [Mortierella sp. AD094]
YPGSASPVLENNEAMAYSCVLMLANAYGDFIRRSSAPSEELIDHIMAGYNTSEIHVSELYRTNPYDGPSGPITLDQNGDRKTRCYNSMSIKNATSVVFAKVIGDNYTSVSRPYFKEGYNSLPRDAPPWAIRNPRWTNGRGITYGVFCIFGIVITLISAGLIYCYQDNIVIKASNALTIKNYRIYRIFNSVTIANQKFQSWLLVRYVALLVVLCVIPVLVEVLIDSPGPTRINIHSYQWVRCKGPHTQTWWYPVGAIIPILLIILGVFLAFKTRNIVYLWNEAQQIALVLYNMFFFALIIGICQFFPVDLFTVTFDLTITAGYVLAFLSLIILFSPKFWKIWKNYQATKRGVPWDGNSGASNRLGFGCDFLRSNGSIGDGGGGGGLHNTGCLLSPSAIGRIPEGLKFGLEATAGETGLMQEKIGLGTPTFSVVTATTPDNNKHVRVQNGDPTKRERTRRGSQADSLVSLSEATKRKGNPITVWMNANLLKRNRNRSSDLDSNTHNKHHIRHENPEVFTDRLYVQCSESQRPLDPQNEERGGSSFGAQSVQIDAGSQDSKPRLRVDTSGLLTMATRREGNTKSSRCGAQRMSSDGKSSSYLMLSMCQVTHDREPIIRVTTSSSGTLLIRFANQDRLDGWMNLFSEEDRIALSAARGSISSLSSLGSTSDSTTCVLNGSQAAKSMATSSMIRNRFSIINSLRKDNHEPDSEKVHLPTTENVRSMGKVLSTIYELDITKESVQTLALAQTLTEALAQEHVSPQAQKPRHGPSPMLSPGGVVTDGCNAYIATVNDIIQQYQPISSPIADNGLYNIPLKHLHESESLDNTHHPLASSSEIGINEERRDGSANIVPQVSEPRGKTRVSNPLPLREHIHPLPQSHNFFPVIASGNRVEDGDDDDDDDDDLYDPEFGIGGNGRRRHKRRSINMSMSRGPAVPSAEVISTAAAAVSAGWSASEALSAAMEDSSGRFLSGTMANTTTMSDTDSTIQRKDTRGRNGSNNSFANFSFFGH